MKKTQQNARTSNNQSPISLAIKLAEEMGLSGDVTLERLSGGRNNRVFKMTTDDKRFLLKLYFFHKNDLHDRLGHEFSFLCYAWKKGIRCIPQPLTINKKQHVALYEFIDGERLKASDITRGIIDQAIYFILDLNKQNNTREALILPPAAEACFSVAEHLDCVEQRLKRLGEIEVCDSISKNAYDFIRRELAPCWRMLKKNISEKIAHLHIDINKAIDNEERCLSPSDFGFHNALREQNQKLHFIDFEYAGWDDPAKLICDFFCQPQIPVPINYIPLFEETIFPLFSKRESLRERIIIFFPVHRIKWCSIMLNEFIPMGQARRNYAKKDIEARHREEQLEKARIYLSESLKYCQR